MIVRFKALDDPWPTEVDIGDVELTLELRLVLAYLQTLTRGQIERIQDEADADLLERQIDITNPEGRQL